MSGPLADPTAADRAFDAAMARGDTEGARALVASCSAPFLAHMRLFSLIDRGVDSVDGFTPDMLGRMQRRAAEAATEHLIAQHHRRQSCSDVRAEARRYDPIGGHIEASQAPWMAFRLIAERCLTDAEARSFTAWAWRHAHYPEQTIGAQAWVVLLRAVESTTGARLHDHGDLDEHGDGHDGAQDARDGTDLFPTEPVTLWRGATRERSLGMAWTADPEQAAWFAERWVGHGRARARARVWRTVADPAWVLARFEVRGETEYVLDPAGLRLVDAGADAVPSDGRCGLVRDVTDEFADYFSSDENEAP